MLTPDTLRKGSKTELIRYAKKKYNKRIERVKKAEEYFKNATIEEFEKNEGTLLLILRELSAIGNENREEVFVLCKDCRTELYNKLKEQFEI